MRRNLKNWIPAAAGFAAASVMVLWLRPVPPRVTSLQAVLFLYGLAIAEVLLVVAAAAATAYVAWFASKFASRNNPPPPRFIWRIASRTAWLVPLYAFSTVRSAWTIVVIALLVLGIVYTLRNLQPAEKQSPALSSNRRIQGSVIAGAAIEAGLAAAGTFHFMQANLLISLATFIVTWNATKGGKNGHPARGLVVIFLAIVMASGALVRRVGVAAGDGFLGLLIDPAIGASLFALQKTFGEGNIIAYTPNRPEAHEQSKAEIEGFSHRGIFLWPEVKKEITLVPPLPSLGRIAFGKDHKSPLTIPFYGAYWFFRFPFNQPPPGSLVVHGSPIIRRFLSNDRQPLWEEAHQDLKTAFDLSCCNSIEIDVTNADERAEFVEIELILVNHSAHGKLIQPLGPMNLTTKPEKVAVPETLSYKIPAHSKVKQFDELVVRFRTLMPHSWESAQVAIERFRLVPRGRR